MSADRKKLRYLEYQALFQLSGGSLTILISQFLRHMAIVGIFMLLP
ncbi:hypothetical protein LHK_02680 [Laribacter hongkongensis HLHK9]|uniref:Uncharacterized protein n=1 Tax=Laribacter hongkongensis (strain HLHK9) TaxID=557598 RepID=C1DCP2_LARHH|nr:hypothetical protein LHK_02680 [Laribacter hongkongensis HLHK9]